MTQWYDKENKLVYGKLHAKRGNTQFMPVLFDILQLSYLFYMIVQKNL